MKSAFKIGLHLHPKYAETFHILEGEVEFRVESRTHIARAGTSIHMPPNTTYAAQVINGRPARTLIIHVPADFEHCLEEMKTVTLVHSLPIRSL